ncbi:MgtC/SapB family protein [Tumidithrix elongata RA019]|uniref:MgtC/SapB family protein n=1 Tax=Tumidithrix elongata BACA0141 TaxID=2716417 RepID=A0AAW9PYX2_9CYAN|nr:MgtC/SapB family protein [Tumidithrix elongata RA019]
MTWGYAFLMDDWLIVICKLSLSLFVGGLIGWERQLAHKPAGLRTHMLVSFGSTLFVMVPLHVGGFGVHPNPDALSRVIQGVTAGIGFLGAGEILHQSRNNRETKRNTVKVQGLTSAAAIWVSAALGVAVGAGLYAIGLIGAVFTLFTLKLIKYLEGRIPSLADRTPSIKVSKSTGRLRQKQDIYTEDYEDDYEDE